MSEEARLRAGEVKQSDAGRGKAMIDDEIMQTLRIKVGDPIELRGKRVTAAVAWSAYLEDQDKGIVRIDGFTRKNAGVAVNEYVHVKRAEVKEAQSIALMPVDMRLNVDNDFVNFVKSQLLERPLVKGDSVYVVISGSAIPFTVANARPYGIVKTTVTTKALILDEPLPEQPCPDPKRLRRRAWLRNLIDETRAEAVKFIIPDRGEWDDESPALSEASKLAEDLVQPVTVFVELRAESGPIKLKEPLRYAQANIDGSIQYVYDEAILGTHHTEVVKFTPEVTLATLPKRPLSHLSFPRRPSSEEKDVLWKAFLSRLAEKGINWREYRKAYDERIKNWTFRSWDEVRRYFEELITDIEEASRTGEVRKFFRLPPMPWKDRGDAIVHLTATKLYKSMEELIDILRSYGVDDVTPEEVKKAIREAWRAKDVWFASVSREYLEALIGERLE